jgi:cytochrome c oxidase subunit III
MSTNKKATIHPHKFTMWIAMGSMVMAFAGLTSSVIVRSNQPNWTTFAMPKMFLISTIVIIISSLTMHLTVRAFKKREMPTYRILITITALLGIAFFITQYLGFAALNKQGLDIKSTNSASYIYVIALLHMLHVAGGIVALVVTFLKAYSTKVKVYNSVGIEIVATYWHFVDILWIYLYLFLLFIIG